MPAPRIIKKYPNRRLYDTERSRYVTLLDIRELVMVGCAFQVIDTTDNSDITRAILLQIMLEEESEGKPLFSEKMLSQLIYFYGGTLQGLFAHYLEESLNMFAHQQQQACDVMENTPFDAMTRLARQNLDLWNEWQKTFLFGSGLAPEPVQRDNPEADKAEAEGGKKAP